MDSANADSSIRVTKTREDQIVLCIDAVKVISLIIGIQFVEWAAEFAGGSDETLVSDIVHDYRIVAERSVQGDVQVSRSCLGDWDWKNGDNG